MLRKNKANVKMDNMVLVQQYHRLMAILVDLCGLCQDKTNPISVNPRSALGSMGQFLRRTLSVPERFGL